MNLSEDISKEMDKRGMSPSDLSRMIGYSPQYVIDILKGNRRWNETTLNKTCSALGLELKVVPASKKAR